MGELVINHRVRKTRVSGSRMTGMIFCRETAVLVGLIGFMNFSLRYGDGVISHTVL